jgi:cell wall-associated NlpC family hydrolase
MRQIVPVALIALAALMASHVQAAPGNSGNPGNSGDELDRLLADKGLFTQIDNVGKTVRLKASELVVNAMGFLGVPYKRGGNTAEGGFDCSGFVRAMYEQSVGLLLPRRAEQQAAATQRIEKTELQPGDLVFFNTLQRAFSHVGIYVGDGKFIHSPKPGAQVRVENMGISYWSSRFDGARRVASGGGSAPSAGNAPAAVLQPTPWTAPAAAAATVQSPAASYFQNPDYLRN